MVKIEEASLSDQVLALLREGVGREQIQADLVQKGHDSKFVEAVVSEAIKLRNSKAMAQGLTLILVGAFICLMSFVLSITASATNLNFPLVLYGLTSVGIIVVFAGFVKVF